MKRIAVLGSTGSIGANTLKVIASLSDRFEVVALSANSNIDLLARQASLFRPKMICVTGTGLEKRLKGLLGRKKIKVFSGEEGLSEIVSRGDVDMAVFAISGNICLRPLLKAISCGKGIALANKEALVAAGELVMKAAAARGLGIIPIDSEHSAIFQCLEGRSRRFLRRIFLTSSGGPLLNVHKRRFRSLKKKFILKHPRWNMGRKITVDSATLINKGLEIIEARWLFDIDESKIDVLVHPEAVVHSMVELVDGAVLAQLAVADMRLPIQYALSYPDREASLVENLDLVKAKRLTFMKPDLDKFPSLALARQALRYGGTYPAVLNAADEEAVTSYLGGGIQFYRIPEIIEDVLAGHKDTRNKALSLEDVLEADAWARREARRLCCRF